MERESLQDKRGRFCCPAGVRRTAEPSPFVLPGARRVLIALGSNVGDVAVTAATIVAAAERIGRVSGVAAKKLSPLYRSEPAYLEDQAEFCNAVLLADVDPALDPRTLLHELQAIEREFGRVRTVPNGPRTLDVDIIDFEGVTSADPELLLPHPLALERDFVVTPLLDVAPGHVLANGVPVTRAHIAYGRVRGLVPADAADTAACHERWAAVLTTPALRATPPKEGNYRAHVPLEENYFASNYSDVIEPSNAPVPAGILSICATPIGNLGDLTRRVAETLEAADLIFAEDTRVARRLLSHLGIHAKPERCDENTIRQRSPGIVERIGQGSRVALISDAGMPGIADPGGYLIDAVRAADLPLEVLPGPSAVTAALVVSGFAGRPFYFGGFLPRKRTQLVKALEELAPLDAALVFFESPHRTGAALDAIAEVFPEREIAVARELTKLHEEVLRAPAPALAHEVVARERAGHPLKGEITLVIAPPPRQRAPRVHRDKYGAPLP